MCNDIKKILETKFKHKFEIIVFDKEDEIIFKVMIESNNYVQVLDYLCDVFKKNEDYYKVLSREVPNE